eukprot:1177120-Prorocentrum_minimum.AAC.4
MSTAVGMSRCHSSWMSTMCSTRLTRAVSMRSLGRTCNCGGNHRDRTVVSNAGEANNACVKLLTELGACRESTTT